MARQRVGVSRGKFSIDVCIQFLAPCFTRHSHLSGIFQEPASATLFARGAAATSRCPQEWSEPAQSLRTTFPQRRTAIEFLGRELTIPREPASASRDPPERSEDSPAWDRLREWSHSRPPPKAQWTSDRS